MKSIKKLAVFGLLAMSLMSFVPTKAAARNNIYYGNVYSSRYSDYNDYYGYNRTNRNSPMFRFTTDSDYFRSPYFYRHYSNYNYIPDYVGARRVIIVDRDDPYRSLSLRNYLTRPNSVNVATVRLDSDIFNRLYDRINLDQNFDVSVDTGGNTVSFNTIAGDLVSGDVDVDIR